MSDLSLEDRALGAFLGLAIGDALGATVEFMTASEIKGDYGVHKRIVGGGWLRLKAGDVTDDTWMSIHLGRAILIEKGWVLQTACDQFAQWLRSGPIDVGSCCQRGIRRYIVNGTQSANFSEGDGGNGAAMRCLPVIIAFFRDPERMGKIMLEQAHITHNHPFSDAACLALAEMVGALLSGAGDQKIEAIAEKLVETHRAFKFRPYRSSASGYIVDTMQTVLHGYFHADDFESAMIETVNQGGDADTTGAILGMLAGARSGASGLPAHWLKKLNPSIRAEIAAMAPALLALEA